MIRESGRAYLASAPVVPTTAAAAERLGGTAQELPTWRHHTLGDLRTTGVPDGTTDLTGPVTGFVLSGDEVPTGWCSSNQANPRHCE